MDKFKQLLQQCENLKLRIKELESLEVTEHQQSIKAIQLEMLKLRLSEVGRHLLRMTIYKRDEDD